jgi:signal transduction histidine kinase
MQDINFNVNISDNLLIKASENHIVQVFVNLITNACKAIVKKGNKDGSILITAKELNQNVIIEISDNGIGMNSEVENKIFEPFYTTREAGEGLGLGLSICYTILKNHNATISVNSEENKGTQFILTFPKP